MPAIQFGEIIATYNRTLAESGCTAAGAHWESQQRQLGRFDLLAGLFEGPFTLNDFGCGYGAFFDYASARLPIARYFGTDATPAMINSARDRISDPRVTLECATTVTRVADYTVASGVFALVGSNSRDRWHAWVLAALRNMWQFSRRGIGFNMLRFDAPGINDDFYFGDPDEFKAWCQQHLSTEVELLTPIGGNDWTILVRRP